MKPISDFLLLCPCRSTRGCQIHLMWLQERFLMMQFYYVLTNLW